MLIDKPGIYNVSSEDYHADPCPTPSLSSSIVKVLVTETPLHAWTAHPRLNPNFEPDEDDKFIIGTAAHSLILGDPKQFAILQYDDFRKKEAQDAKAKAKAAGKIPLLEKHWRRLDEMVSAALDQMSSSTEFSNVFRNGKPEQTLIWCEGDGADALWFRARPDWLPDDRDTPYDDYKTSEVSDPEKWARSILFSVRHDIQAAFYRRGIRALGLNRQPKMRFVIQEPTEPFCLSGVEMTGEILELADREIERAIRRWRWCRENNHWPGYPAKFHRPDMPGWLETARMEAEIRRDDAAKAAKIDPDLLAASFIRQSPI